MLNQFLESHCIFLHRTGEFPIEYHDWSELEDCGYQNWNCFHFLETLYTMDVKVDYAFWDSQNAYAYMPSIIFMWKRPDTDHNFIVLEFPEKCI